MAETSVVANPAEAPKPAVEMVNLTVDGKSVAVPKGTLAITAAFHAGADVPYFCHHPRLKPVGSCRMCLVRINNAPVMTTACTTPVAENMIIDTVSPEVKQAQNGILEFLLINHPLDCPICDRGGECPLQNMTFQYGPGVTRFIDEKRHFPKAVAISDYVMLDRERCIQCARCTRFTEEISGDGELAIENRGNGAIIAPFTPEGMKSKFSGNTIELCPVGALTSRKYRFAARPWEFQSQDSTCAACGVGCSIAVQTRNGDLMRINGRLNEEINEEWTCDRGKFEQYWINDPDRALYPQLRLAAQLARVSWDDAIKSAAAGLKDAATNPAAVAGIASAKLSNEDLYLFQRLFRNGLNSNNIDHRITPTSLQAMQTSIADIGRAKKIVAIGADIDDVLPVLWLRIYKAISKNGAAYFRDDDPSSKAVSEAIASGDGTIVLVWHTVPQEKIDALNAAAAASGAKINVLLPDANSRGAISLGVLPDTLPGQRPLGSEAATTLEALWGAPLPAEPGLDVKGILDAAVAGKIKALYLAGVDLLNVYPDRDLVLRAFDRIPHIVVQDVFVTETARAGKVFLASSSYIERDGTLTNIEGRVQHFHKAIPAKGQSRADWLIFSELLAALGKPASYTSARDITQEIEKASASAG